MKAVILAGGLGSRLKPFTDIIPKPLLPLGEKSLMEVQIERLKASGVTEVYLALNYKSDYIQSFLGNGENFGIKIHYSIEDHPLGTCGPLTLLKDKLDKPFFLMNGDILTKLDFNELYSFAQNYEHSPFTLSTKIITTPFRFGNIEADGVYLTGIEEKPELKFEILAGIYVMKPDIFQHIPENIYFGIDDLIKVLLQKKVPITKFLIRDYWIDIGVIEDYEKAREVYKTHFEK
jgi:NDP-mannose synthase